MIEVLKQALDAFETAAEGGGINFYAYAQDLRQAIAELEKQEPVAWVDAQQPWDLYKNKPQVDAIPLYTLPQPRKPLTLEHLRLYWKHAKVFDELHVDVGFPDYVLLVRDTESQHGIGE
jgi:hypothetical protein